MKIHWKKQCIIYAICVLLCFFTACKPSVSDIQYGVADVDYPVQIGEITLTESPMRIAVYSDSIADVLSALGSAYELKMVARGADCVHPNIAVLPTAGTVSAPQTEKLTKLKVTLILTENAFSEESNAAMARLGIQVLVVPKATGRNELIALYETVASALAGGKTGYLAGEKRAKSLLSSLDDIERVIPKSETVTVGGFVTNADGAFATDETLAGKLLRFVGVTNLAADRESFTAESLQLANPSVLFCPAGLRSQILADERFRPTDAVLNDRVYEITAGSLIWQGNYLLSGALEMANALYPKELGEPTESEAESSASEKSESKKSK